MIFNEIRETEEMCAEYSDLEIMAYKIADVLGLIYFSNYETKYNQPDYMCLKDILKMLAEIYTTHNDFGMNAYVVKRLEDLGYIKYKNAEQCERVEEECTTIL